MKIPFRPWTLTAIRIKPKKDQKNNNPNLQQPSSSQRHHYRNGRASKSSDWLKTRHCPQDTYPQTLQTMSPAGCWSPPASPPPKESRYLASDFDRLTIRATRRFTSPAAAAAATPDLARPQAHEPRLPSAAPLKIATPDKRDASFPQQSTPCSSQLPARVNLAPADLHGPGAAVSVGAIDGRRSGSIGGAGPLSDLSSSSSRNRRGNNSSASGGQLDACVKEDGSGKFEDWPSAVSHFTQYIAFSYDTPTARRPFLLPIFYVKTPDADVYHDGLYRYCTVIP